MANRPDSLATDQDVAWTPAPSQAAVTRLAGFMRRLGVADLPALQIRARDDPQQFWATVAADLGIRWRRPPDRWLDTTAGLPWSRFFVGARWNYVAAALGGGAGTEHTARTAVLWEGEDGVTARLSYRELAAQVERAAGALAALGVAAGDRVGIALPMLPETVVAVLACGYLGAIYTPIFSGSGAPALADRLNNCAARLLITVDGFFRRGQIVPFKETADDAVRRCPSVEHTLVIRRCGQQIPWRQDHDVWWHEALGAQHAGHREPADTAAGDPFLLIYTSGTTGPPKATVHVHAGFPFKAAQDLAHCFDLRCDDRLFWFTDLGWMMGPWAICGALLHGATVVLYEGAPDYPTPDRLWALVARHRVTMLGMAPTLVRSLMRFGTAPLARYDRSSLRVLGSSGEPWNVDPWWWYFREVGNSRLPIVNYSGGTEVSGGIVSGNLISPLKPCSFAGPCPGMAADIVDAEGRSLVGSGQVGELVVRAPWPGMTAGFWHDPERYLATYWARWPEVWAHGDWARADADGCWYLLGRSDDTIKVAGKRVGPAEVESAAVAYPAVAEAAAIGVPEPVKGEVMVLMAVLHPAYQASPALAAAVSDHVALWLGKPLRPARVVFVTELPRTRSAKILRRVVRSAYLGLPPGDLSALENPTAVEAIRAAGQQD
ncbi:MAG: AMP-binding protein [Chloroflexota bacterium]